MQKKTMTARTFKSWKFIIGFFLISSLVTYRFYFTKHPNIEPFPLSSYRLFTSVPPNIVKDIYIAVYSINGKELDVPQDIFKMNIILYNKHKIYKGIQKLPLKSKDEKTEFLSGIKKRFFPNRHLTFELRERTFKPRDIYLRSITLSEKTVTEIISL